MKEYKITEFEPSRIKDIDLYNITNFLFEKYNPLDIPSITAVKNNHLVFKAVDNTIILIANQKISVQLFFDCQKVTNTLLEYGYYLGLINEH